jgi:hypothetical protein
MPRHLTGPARTIAAGVIGALWTLGLGEPLSRNLFPVTHAQARLPYGPIPVDCDRACLTGLVDQYLAAVVAHDPKRLPLSADVKYTENDQAMAVGDGFWGTATGIGGYKLVVPDPVSGQVGFIGSMREWMRVATA